MTWGVTVWRVGIGGMRDVKATWLLGGKEGALQMAASD